MKWETIHVKALGLSPPHSQIRAGGIWLATFYGKAHAEKVVADHNLLERFADPKKAIELLMEFVHRADVHVHPMCTEAGGLLCHPALQPPKEKS